MIVHLDYGDSGLGVDLPGGAVVLEPPPAPALRDPAAAVADALAHPTASPPLRDLVQPGSTVAIAVSDVTRPVPNHVLLPPVLDVLRAAGVPNESVAIIVGTGMHRPSTPDEVQRLLGPDIAAAYPVAVHDARDAASLARLTTTARGAEVLINRRYLEARVKIVTGFIEPHIFAGYSGGGKGVMPGLAGAEIVMSNHGADMIAHANATWCVTDGNPIFEEQRDLALLTRPLFLLNVTLSPQRAITGVFAGELAAAHDAGIAQAERQYVRAIDAPFDIVVSTNMGYPADLNLYQSVKGMSVAAQAVRAGGAIVLAAECRDGLGLDEYVQLLTSEASPRALLQRIRAPGFARYDQWQIQCQAMVQARAQVWLHSSMPRETVESAHLAYSADVAATVDALRRSHVDEHGREPSIAVLPHGQLTVPRLGARG